MSETKHSPGKWELTVDDEHDGCDWVITDSSGVTIAMNNQCTSSDETELANARLIVKASELLDALEFFVRKECDHCGNTEYQIECADNCFMLRYIRLIAEVKGEKK
jgi:hypothetical protein